MLGALPALRLHGVVDTGADVTVVSQAVIARMKLPRCGYATIRGVRGTFDRPDECNYAAYYAKLTIEGLPTNLTVYQGGFHDPDLLIGRDVLKYFDMTFYRCTRFVITQAR